MITFTTAQLDAWLGTLLWPFVRFLALLSSAPVLGHRSVPVRVKIGLAMLLTLIVAPNLPAIGAVPLGTSQGIALLLQQLAVGLALGFSVSLVFSAIEMAGDLIGLQMGLSFASFIDPESANQSPLIGSFLNLLAMLIFLTIDGHLMMVDALVNSFASVPIGVEVRGMIDWQQLVTWGTQVFMLGLQLALPVLAAVFLSNLALGVLTRAAPQLNLFAIGFPITLLLGLLILWIALPHFGPFLEQALYKGMNILTR